jgi:hypothetical protein
VNRILEVASIEEAFMVGADELAVENGEIDAHDFEFMWGVSPDSYDWVRVEV